MGTDLIISQADFQNYAEIFVQRQPRYCIKSLDGKAWRTKNKTLADLPVISHLEKQIIVGVLAKWYPGYAIFDFDDTDRGRVDDIRDRLTMNSNNSMLMTSESHDSYHLLFRPAYNRQPPTIRLLGDVMRPFAAANSIEIYPQARKAVRLPFGYRQDPVDNECLAMNCWTQKLQWFTKLLPFDLGGMPGQQLQFNFDVKPEHGNLSTYQAGLQLFQTGLMLPGTRHDSQWRVLYYLWRQNIPLDVATDMTWQWIRTRHNGFSHDIITAPQQVRAEIERQAARIYGNYEAKIVYPDSTHNDHGGFITKADIDDIITLAAGSIPKARFIFNLVKYTYPRRHRAFIQLHSDNLMAWSRRGYQAYLDELQARDIVTRYDSYQATSFAKSIKIKWHFRDADQAVLVDGRAPESLEDTIRSCYTPEAIRELLQRAGSARTTAIMATKMIFEGVKNVQT